MGETRAHIRLKQIGARFLLNAGCVAIACEVRCPFARYRVDVAGFLDSRRAAPADPRQAIDGLAGPLWGATPNGARALANDARRERCEPRTAFIECKQDRADFLRDGDEKDALLRKRASLERRMREVQEGYIKEQEPHLRDSGAFLFGDMETWNYAASRSGAYRRILKDLRLIDERLHGHTKFWLASRYRLADRLYVLAPAGMISMREVPSGWGLLEVPNGPIRRRAFDAAAIAQDTVIARPAPELGARAELRSRLLRNIAAASTRAVMTMEKASMPRLSSRPPPESANAAPS